MTYEKQTSIYCHECKIEDVCALETPTSPCQIRGKVNAFSRLCGDLDATERAIQLYENDLVSNKVGLG